MSANTPQTGVPQTGNPVHDIQLNHRTIRFFKDQPLEQDKLERLFDVAVQTPTSTGMQLASVIHVTDPALKDALAEVSTQRYLADSPVLLIYLVDLFRSDMITKEADHPSLVAADIDKFVQGFTDAVLMAQNVNLAAEAMDLGAVFFGSILNNPAKVIELLKLPHLTFPVLGHGIGYPDDNPQLKPRIPKEYRIFENQYRVLPDYHAALRDYDAVMAQYYDTRDTNKRVDSFTKQVIKRFELPNLRRQAILQDIRNQGFHVDESLATNLKRVSKAAVPTPDNEEQD